MRTIGMVAIAAGLATLAACSSKEAVNNADNASLTEGIEINNAEIYANDANAATDVNTANAADANATNVADANAATNNAQ